MYLQDNWMLIPVIVIVLAVLGFAVRKALKTEAKRQQAADEPGRGAAASTAGAGASATEASATGATGKFGSGLFINQPFGIFPRHLALW